MKKLTLAFAAFAVLFGAAAAQADNYPSHPITLMVGFPPGGPTDALARLLASGMEKTLHQPIVVETATAVYSLTYNVETDLQPISLLAASPLLILGKNAIPPKTATELIAWLKTRTQPTTFGTVGAGSAGHLCGLSFAQKTGARFQYVPYRGAAPAFTDLLGGQIELACLEASASLPYVQAAKFKAFAVMSEQRWPKAPDLPTMIQSGVPGLTINFWHGLWTTKGTPQDVVNRLDGAVKTALADPVVKDRLQQLGQVIFPADQQNPAALAAYQKAEIAKWWPIIKAAGIKTN